MPASSNTSAAYGWRESWPPAQIRLQQAASTGGHSSNGTAAMVKEESRDGIHDDDMQLTDDSPLVYFLTPTPLLSTDEDGDSYFVDDSDSSSFFYNENDNDDDAGFYSGGGMDFEFDAGIEDTTHPQPIIRSVSPSSLAESLGGNGGRTSRRSMRPSTPPRINLHPGSNGLTGADPSLFNNMDSAIEDGDDDDEHYIHFGDGNYSSPRSPSSSPAKGRLSPRSSSYSLSPPPLSSSPASPRSLPDIQDLDAHHHLNNSQSHLTAAGAMIVRRRSPRSWRVPSPDVFSIEEETEEELSASVTSPSIPDRSTRGRHHHNRRYERHLQVEAAKPPMKKRVRFVLPGEEAA